MSYTALYRKWRPTGFADVKGQDHIVQTLKPGSALVMPICSAEHGEPEKLPLPRFLQRQSTVNILLTEAHAESVRAARALYPAVL